MFIISQKHFMCNQISHSADRWAYYLADYKCLAKWGKWQPKTQKCKALLIDLAGYFFVLQNSTFSADYKTLYYLPNAKDTKRQSRFNWFGGIIFFGLPNSIFRSVRLKFCACLALFTNHQVAFRQNAPNVKNDKNYLYFGKMIGARLANS